MILATTSREARSSDPKARAEASFKKEERERDGAKAMLEYLASGREIREQMARLKALRLAKEAQEAQDEARADGVRADAARPAVPAKKTRKTAAGRKPAKVAS
jgi:hypothetical protein